MEVSGDRRKEMTAPTDREALVKRLKRWADLPVPELAKDVQEAITALSAQGGERRVDLVDPLRFLVELKHIKRRIETKTATEGEVKFYESNKEIAWLNAERALVAAAHGGEQTADTVSVSLERLEMWRVYLSQGDIWMPREEIEKLIAAAREGKS
jgi:hypothetical protein